MAKYDDRLAVLEDFKRRIILLRENNQQLPSVAWDAEPLRYYKLNQEWVRIVFGWMDWLEDIAGWPEAQDENYEGIQGILAFEEGIELPEGTDFDCGDVEDCLGTSDIINNLIDLINDMADEIKELEDEQGTGKIGRAH